MNRDQQIVDEAMRESFPASDAPSWTPTHAGTPAHVQIETPRELRERLRGDFEIVRRNRSADSIANTLLLAGRSVTRIPLTRGSPAENVEALVRGAANGPEIIVGATYAGPEAPDPSAAAVLIGLARVLEGRHFARNVRLVAFANDPKTTGARAYAKRLHAQRAPIGAAIVLGHLGHAGGLSLIVDRGASHVRDAAREVWGGGTPVPLRSMVLPRSLGFLWPERRAFAREGWPSAIVTTVWPKRVDVPAFDTMADVVFGLAAVVARLAGNG